MHAGIGARVVQAALRDHRPTHILNRAVGADHVDAATVAVGLEAGGLRGAQLQWKVAKLGHDAVARAGILAGHPAALLRMRHDAALAVDHVDHAAAHGIFLQALEDSIE